MKTMTVAARLSRWTNAHARVPSQRTRSPTPLETTPGGGDLQCIVCGCARLQPLLSHRISWLHRCLHCGLARVYPAPDPAELAAIYDARYFNTFGYKPADESGYRQARGATFNRLLAAVERYFVPGALLDVGSGVGDLLAQAARRGWSVRGVEPNCWAAEQADHVAPGATQVCAIEEFDPCGSPCDLITCLDVLEHLRRPDETLGRFYSSLLPGGGLLLTTPDAGSPAARAMGASWPHFHRDHLWYFNRETLVALVERAGFEVILWRRAKKIFNVAYIAGIFEENSLSASIRRIATACLRFCPPRLARLPLPAVPEGQLLIARRPSC